MQYASECSGTRTHNYLVLKRTLNHVAKMAKWFSCVACTYLYGAFDCMFLSWHICFSAWIQTLVWLLLVGTTPGVSLYKSLTMEGKHLAVITQDRGIDNNLKKQIKNGILYTYRLFLLTLIFKYISNWSKSFELLATFFLYTWSNKFRNFSR